ncbi:sulfite exporter TauE/SafE family protein [Tsukamurella soli]|uniref:sulfite exporter TauE/SafE family protein n=1 Tax=Tsukamurella soli TaxID=644556 RepID=UPI0031EF229C
MPVLVLIGAACGVTTVLFGFGGGFVAVPVVVWADSALGPDAMRVAVATSAVVMVVNATVATASAPREVLAGLRRSGTLLALLAVGGALGAAAARFVSAPVIAWCFVAYVAATILDTVIRPGFLRRGPAGAPRPLPAAVGVPIGAVASFLGVGGSVLTVPMLRRAGHPMESATVLANPLTAAISIPAAAVFLLRASGHPVGAHGGVVGAVDMGAAAVLLVGAIPVIVWLRRRGPKIPDAVHARCYVAMLAAALVAMTVAAV